MNDIDQVIALFAWILIFCVIMNLLVLTVVAIGKWKVFEKAGKPGWAAIIPIYNLYVILEIAELPTWYLVLYFIPFANIYVQIYSSIELAKKFGEKVGFAIGLFLLPIIFWPILGFGKSEYLKEINKFCTNCGNKLNNGAHFCEKCGFKVD